MKNTVMRTLWGMLFLLALAGCVRSDVVATMASHAAWQRLDAAGPLPAVGWMRGQADVIHIYIEGDGVAYATPTRPSLDPTPITPTALLLAQRDNAPAVAYLGRPCQYVTGAACSSRCWTTGRFSAAVLQTMTGLVDAAKASAGARRVVLIGFSGGGAVATLLAARRTDVAALITVCGNLDHAAWTAMHHVTPLYGSLNPAEYAARLSSLPQTHFMGGADTNVTRQITDSFVSRLGPGAPVTVRVVPGLAHGGEAWARAWPALLAGVPLGR
ncbi:MAG: alpha/beta hydrolase [Proteobacteria bacterium]|nr:alpha/beta hydrolase [Pseudomonadota bacterium]